MEWISYFLAKSFQTYWNKDERWLHINQYYIQIFLEKWIGLSAAGIIAALLDMTTEYLIFLAVFMPIRSWGGGFHMKTYGGCFFTSILLITSELLLVKYIPCQNMISLWVLISELCTIPLQLMAPVIHINRPLSKKEKDTCQRSLRKFLWILRITILILAVYHMGNYILLIGETLLVLCFSMFLGKHAYEKTVLCKSDC